MRCLILKIRFRLQSGLQTVLFGKESTWVFGVTNGPKSVRHMYSSLRAKSDCQSEVSRINKTEVIKRQQKNEKRFGSKRLCSALRFAPSGHTSNTIRVKVFPVFFTFSWVVFRPLELARRRKSHSQRLAVSKNFLVYKKIPKFGVSSCYFSSGRTRSRTGEPLEMPAVEWQLELRVDCDTLLHTATYCDTLRHTASTHCFLGSPSPPWTCSMTGEPPGRP